MELKIPLYESVPYSLKISINKLVAADDENIFITTNGNNSDGKCNKFVTGFIVSYVIGMPLYRIFAKWFFPEHY